MGNGKKTILSLVVAAVICTACFTGFFGNLWCVFTCRGYRIPDDSSLFTFRVTQWNDGSGEWWNYGQDGRYYYVLIGADYPPYYAKIAKAASRKGSTLWTATLGVYWIMELIDLK